MQLEAEFARSQNWTQAQVTVLAARVGMERTKVYKWWWDRKRKEERLLARLANTTTE